MMLLMAMMLIAVGTSRSIKSKIITTITLLLYVPESTEGESCWFCSKSSSLCTTIMEAEPLNLGGFSRACRFSCAFLLPLWLKHLPHISHRYGFSPVCLSLCLRRLECSVKDLLQVTKGQTYGRSPSLKKIISITKNALIKAYECLISKLFSDRKIFQISKISPKLVQTVRQTPVSLIDL